jgi:DNA-binding MarR family transcriptional regulator
VQTADDRITGWGLVMEATATVNRRLERDLVEALDLPLAWFEVLLRLGRTEGGAVALNALAAQVSFSSGGFSRLVDRMEARRLVERRACPTNRRSTLVTLTGHGREVLEEAARLHGEGLERYYYAHLSEDRRAAIADGMRAVRDAG